MKLDLEVLPDGPMRLPEGDRHGRGLFDSVQEGLSPFKAYQIYSHLEYEIDYHRYLVHVTVVFKSGRRLHHFEKVGAFDLSDHPDREMSRIDNLMFHAFRNRKDHTPEPNVYLGEN